MKVESKEGRKEGRPFVVSITLTTTKESISKGLSYAGREGLEARRCEWHATVQTFFNYFKLQFIKLIENMAIDPVRFGSVPSLLLIFSMYVFVVPSVRL